MRLVVPLLLLALGCKTDDAGKSAPAKTEPAAKPAPAAPPPEPAPPPPAPAPTKSQQALEQRAQFFGKLSVAAKKHQGDCEKLGAAISGMLDEAKTMAQLGHDIAEPEAAQDKSVTNAAFKAVLLTSSTCADTTQIDAVLDVIAEVPK